MEKKEKHATKIPSSRGLFIEDSSVFFVSGPRVKKKRGEKEKRENFKKDYWQKPIKKKRISKKEKKQEWKKNKLVQEFMFSYCVFLSFFKKSIKTKKGITDTDLWQEKTQDQRRNRLPWFFILNPVLFPLRVTFGSWLGANGKNKRNTALRVWRKGPPPLFIIPTIFNKKGTISKKFVNEKKSSRKNSRFGSWCSNVTNRFKPCLLLWMNDKSLGREKNTPRTKDIFNMTGIVETTSL